MLNRSSKRALILAGASYYFFVNQGLALIKSADGHDEFFLSGSLATGFDSNIDSAAEGKSDVITTATAAVDYIRNAGLIGVSGELSWTRAEFAQNAKESFSDPTLTLELDKKTGRTTGSLALSAGRQSQADAAINQRTVAWNYSSVFNWKYPVIDRYSVGGTLSYGLVDYTGRTNTLTDLTTKSASTDLFYRYNSQRDLLAGYRIRQSDTSASNQSLDQAVTTGVSGKIYDKLRGSARAGYQLRQEGASGQSFGSTTASAALTWEVTKRCTVTGTVEKDFSTTANEASVDNLSFNLAAQYVLTNQWAIYCGVGAGDSLFLNGTDLDREDFYATWNTGLTYALNEHVRTSLVYSNFQNWSNRAASSFERNTLTLNVSTRW